MSEKRLIDVEEFTNMLGFGRQWYYKHKDEPGMPRRIYPGGNKKPKLLLSECDDYVAQLVRARGPIKRKRGRPPKAAALSAG